MTGPGAAAPAGRARAPLGADARHRFFASRPQAHWKGQHLSLRSSAKNTGILQVDSPDRLSPPSTSILKVEVTVVP